MTEPPPVSGPPAVLGSYRETSRVSREKQCVWTTVTGGGGGGAWFTAWSRRAGITGLAFRRPMGKDTA